MTLIGGYIARSIYGAVLFVLFGFLALFSFFDFINELEDIGRSGYRLQHALGHIALSLPSHVYELMPIAALIGTIYALAQFASHSEFTAMRAAGLGRRRALAVVCKVGGVLALATVLVGEVLTPPAERLAQKIRLSALGGTVAGQFKSGLWIKDTLKDADGTVLRQRFVNVGELLSDTTMRGVRVYEFDSEFRLVEIMSAESGRFSPPHAWKLERADRTVFEPMVVADNTVALRATRSAHTTHAWESELSPDILGVLMLVPERMSAWSLLQYVQHLRDNRQRTDRYEIAFWKKIVYPVAVIVMMALALPFAYLQTRAGGIGYKVFAGIMLGVAFHFMNGLFSHLGLLNTWPPWIAVSVPSAIAVVLALGMLTWVDRAR